MSKRDAFEPYETPHEATAALIAIGELESYRDQALWYSCAGCGALSRVLIEAGFTVVTSDLIQYAGAGEGIQTPVDFMLTAKPPEGVALIVVNPPFSVADKFVAHWLDLGLSVVAFLRWQAAEGTSRVRSDLVDKLLRHIWLGRGRRPTLHRHGWAGPRTKHAENPFRWFCVRTSRAILQGVLG